MKNWGHDFLKAEGKEASRSDKHSDKSTKPRTRSHESTKPRTRSHESTKPRTRQHEKENDREDNEHEREKPESDENEDAHGDHAGDKRKPSAEKKKPLKRRETRKGHEDEDAHGDHAGDKRKPSAKKEKPTKKRETSKGHEGSESGESESEGGSESGGYELAKGDTVSWKWGGGHPQGKVLDVKGEKYVSNKPAVTNLDANILLPLQEQASVRRMTMRSRARDSLMTLRLFWILASRRLSSCLMSWINNHGLVACLSSIHRLCMYTRTSLST